MPTVDAQLLQLGFRLAKEFSESQRAKGLRYTGESARSVTPGISRSNNTRRLVMYGLGRIRFQQDGRGPGKYPKPSKELVFKIKKWLAYKGLNYNAYAVAFSINKKGWNVPNRFNSGGVVSDVFGSTHVLGLAKEMLRESIKFEFKGLLLK